MSERAIGTLVIEKFNIPFKIYSVATAQRGIITHLYTIDKQKIMRKWVNEAGEDVAETYRGYEYRNEQGESQVVLLTKEMLETIQVHNQVATFLGFSPLKEALNIKQIEKTYRLKPDIDNKQFSNIKVKTALLMGIMTKDNQGIICEFNIRGREHYGIIYPYEGEILLTQLIYPEYMKPKEKLEFVCEDKDLATKYRERVSVLFKEAVKQEITDDYSERLKKLIMENKDKTPEQLQEQQKQAVKPKQEDILGELDKELTIKN